MITQRERAFAAAKDLLLELLWEAPQPVWTAACAAKLRALQRVLEEHDDEEQRDGSIDAASLTPLQLVEHNAVAIRGAHAIVQGALPYLRKAAAHFGATKP